MKITQADYINAIKRADRTLTLRYSPTSVHKSKKTYNRKQKHKGQGLHGAVQ